MSRVKGIREATRRLSRVAVYVGVAAVLMSVAGSGASAVGRNAYGGEAVRRVEAEVVLRQDGSGGFQVMDTSSPAPNGPSLTPDWNATGENDGDDLGYSVAAAGDVNGDGYGDVIVGAPGYGGGYGPGKAYLFPGSSGGLSTTPVWSDTGELTPDRFGYSVASAGDVNGDGYDDVIVGALFGAYDRGKAFVYYGSASGLEANPTWDAAGEAVFDQFGYSVASAGDVNGDGYGDVIVGARDGGSSNEGIAYVDHSGISELSAVADWTFNGENPYDELGHSVGTAGDVDGDGYDDIIVGAPGYDDDGHNRSGAAYVFHGSATGLELTPAWSAMGQEAEARLGTSVSTAGDVNDDGYADVIVGAPASYVDDRPGMAYAYTGSASGLALVAGWTGQGENVADRYGWSVAGAGDVNRDGHDDVVVGAWADAVETGAAYYYAGASTGLSSDPEWSDVGETAGDCFGKVVAGAGDVNRDGCADILVGAYEWSGGLGPGKAYAYHGAFSGWRVYMPIVVRK
jgi:hypothetical protein